jgi:hypothetical protein
MFERLKRLLFGSSVVTRAGASAQPATHHDSGATGSDVSWMWNQGGPIEDSSPAEPDTTVAECDPTAGSEDSADAGACDSGFDGGGGDSGGGGSSGDY